MMSEEQFSTLLKRLDTLIKLTAINVLSGKSKTEQVAFLSSLGFQPKDIAWIVGTTRGTVKSLKRRLRKRAEKEPVDRDDSENEETVKEKQIERR